MAQRMTVGDAYMAFRADTTDIDGAFERLQASAQRAMQPAKEQAAQLETALTGVAESANQAAASTQEAGAAMQSAATQSVAAGTQISASWVRVAQTTAENQKAQNSLRAALAAVRSTGGQSVAAIQALAVAHERATIAGREHAAAIKEAEAEMNAMASAEIRATVGAEVMGATTKEAGATAAFSMHEAKAEIALLGEETGVKIPRHLRSFVAELPGVGKALDLAFSATAVFMLVQILVEAGTKVVEFYEALSVLSAEEQKAQEEALKTSKEKLDIETKTLQAEYALRIAKADGLEKDRLRLEEARALVALNQGFVSNLQGQIQHVQTLVDKEKERAGATADTTVELAKQGSAAAGGLSLLTNIQNKQVEGGEKVVESLKKTLSEAQNALKEAQAKEIEQRKENSGKVVEQTVTTGQAVLQAQKKVSDAQIDVDLATAKLRLANAQISTSEYIEAEHKAAEQRLENEREYQKQLLALLEKDPTRNAERIREVNAEIAVLEKQREADSLSNYATYLETMKALRKQALGAIETAPIEMQISFTPEQQAIQNLEDTMKQFGIQGSVIWIEQAQAAQAAYDKMKADGVATYTDLLQMEEKLRAARLAAAVSTGDTAEAEQEKKRLEEIQQELIKLGVAADSTAKKQDNLKKSFHDLIKNYSAGKITLKDTLNILGKETAQGIGDAVYAAELGSSSFGEAMQKMAASMLASISAQATVKAIYEMAEGFALLAAQDYTGAGHAFTSAAIYGSVAAVSGIAASAINPSSSSSNGSGGESPSTTMADGITQGPIANAGAPSANVPRFASGGLVSGPTLAILGDAAGPLMGNKGQREVAMPLDNPDALQQIGTALGPYIGGGGTHNHFHIDGLISPDNLTKVVKQINRAVKNNDVQLTASVAYRTTRKA